MPAFRYPAAPHTTRHGPDGYRSYKTFKAWLRDEFDFRCVYCLFRERWYPVGADAFGVDHVAAQSTAGHRVNEYGNLVYACNRCNSLKQDTPLPDPRDHAFGDLLSVGRDGTIRATEPRGEMMIEVLELDHPETVTWRAAMFALRRGRPGPIDYFAFPANLPNLARLKPPTNSLPAGVADCYFARRRRGTLPRWY